MQFFIIPVTPFQQNCTLFWCEQTRHGVVVDPGGDLQKIIEAVNQNTIELQAILLTHGHLDHVGVAAQLKKHFGVPIIGPHIQDKFLFDALPQQGEMFGFGHTESFYPDQWLNDQDHFSFGNHHLTAIHCPGHTPGHVVFVEKDSRIAQTGDVLFKGAVGRTDFPQGNHQDLIHSIHKKLLPLGQDIRFIPGHGPMSEFGSEQISNPFLKSG